MNSTFSKTEKIVFSIVGVFCIILATVGGVLSANAVAGLHFGEAIKLATLDAQDESVGMINILLLGVDEGGMRSDTIMLASINGKENKVNILSIPRDTRVRIGKGYQKINAAIGIGAQEVKKGNLEEPEELSVEKVKALTGLPIHYFMSIDFEGFKEVIDVLDGVDFEVPFNMVYDDPTQNLHINLKKGMQHLDGEAAHDFVRFRQGNPGYRGYANGDLGRIEAQQAFIRALVKQKLKPEYILKANELFEVISKYVRTNYTARDLVKHIGVIKNLTPSAVKMHQLPNHTQTIDGLSYVICHDDELEKLIQEEFIPKKQ